MPGNVLVIDDEPEVLRVVGRFLEKSGFKVTTADSAEKGLELARKSLFSAVVMDVELPGMSGLGAIEEMRKHCAVVILMTGHADAELAKDATLLGAQALISKPFDLEGLKAALTRK